MLFWDACIVYAAHIWGYWATVMVTCAMDNSQWSTACAKIVIRNQLLFTPLLAPLLLVATTQPFSTSCLLWQIPGAVVLSDIFFYPMHRMLHHHTLYSMHAAHHEWEKPIGMSALYADVFEHCVVNMVPPLLSGIVVGMNPAVMALWAAAASANTVWAHAWENQHTDHHELRTKNFGVGLMAMDRVMGTLYTEKKPRRK